MSDNNLSGKVSLDVTDYKAGVSELNRQIRVIESGFRASAAAMGEWDKNATGLEMRTKALTSQIDLQKQKIAALTSEYEKVVEEKGADSRAAQELEIKLNKQNETLGKMTVELDQTNSALDKMGDESKSAGGKVQDLGEKQEQTAQKSESFKSALNGMVGGLKATLVATAALAIAVVGLAGGMAKMVMSSASAADNLVEMSAKTGISVERLQELSYIGKQTGTDLETVTSANARLIRSMDYAAQGTGIQAEAFNKLGVSVVDSSGNLRNSQTVFQEALTKLGEMSNETERDAAAMALFGKSAQELNPLIKTSAEELGEMTESAHGFGAVMSDQAVSGLADLNDLLDGLKDGLRGTLGEISAAFLPGIKGMTPVVSGYMRDLVEIVQGSNGNLGSMASGIGGLLGKILSDIAGKGPEMLQGGLGMIQGIMDALTENLPIMLPAVITMIQTLVGFIVQNIPMLIDAGVQILLMLVTSLISMLPMLLTAAIEIIVQLANGLSEALPSLIPAVVGIIMQLVLTLVQNIPMLITAALQLIMALATGLIAALPVLMDMLPTIMIELVNGLLLSLPELLVAAVQIILTLALGIIENIPKMLAMMPQVIDALVKEFKSDAFKVKIKSMGEDIVHGISEGFTKAWENFKAHFMSNWNELVDKVKDLLGIHSPSTVFAEIGVNMALGLGGGFSKQMANVTQQIQNAMAGIAANSTMDANLNVNQNGSANQQVVGPKGNVYQAFFETYNENQFNRYLRQTEMLYGS
jgi:hypothetical protein